MSEAIWGFIGIIMGTLLSFLGQVVYYHFIEKGKLGQERKFSFRKENLFKLKEKFEEIQNAINYINSKSLVSTSLLDVTGHLFDVQKLISVYFSEIVNTSGGDFWDNLISYFGDKTNNKKRDLYYKTKNKLIKDIQKTIKEKEYEMSE